MPRSLWLYRALLMIYPRAFRRRYRSRLERAFLADLRSDRRSGPAFWAWILRDTLSSALAERFSAAPTPAPPEPPRPSRVDMIRDFLHDLRVAARSLLATPSFTLVAVSILAVGIGANAVVFTLVGTLFGADPEGIRAPEELVRITRTNDRTRSSSFSYADYEYVRDNARSFAGIAGFDPAAVVATMRRGSADEVVPVSVELVSGDYFDVLGVPMAKGGPFAAADAAVPGEGLLLVASHGFWESSLGAREELLGSTVHINNRPFRIVGVAAEGYRGPGPLGEVPDFWAPVSAQPVVRADGSDAWLERVPRQRINWLSAIGRLAPGVSLQQARAELDRVNQQLREQFPEDNEDLGMAVWERFDVQPSAHDRMVELARLLGAVALVVLLIVCANIAILQLARASARQQEIGIRSALGAGRGRIIRQLMTESLLLAGVGALAGWALAFQGSTIVKAWLPLPLGVSLRPDATVLMLSMGTAVLVAIGFGLVPALGSARADVVRAIRSRAVIGGRRRLRSALVIAQVALSVVLVIGAALFVRSLLAAEAVDPGFATENRVLASVFTGSLGYSDQEQSLMVDGVLERLRDRPSVESAGAAAMAPFRGRWSTDFPAPGAGEGGEQVTVLVNSVTPGYFRTMEIPLLSGRTFDETDRPGTPTAVIVNEAMAEMLWPGEDPVGRNLAMRSDEGTDRVVGVVANADYGELGEDPEPVGYLSMRQHAWPYLIFIAATDGDPDALSRAVREEVMAADPDLAISSLRTIEGIVEGQLGTYRLGARAVGTFGLLAALLAAAGLYGVLSYFVAGGTREIGVRMALGDTESGVLAKIVGRGLHIAGIGIAVGLAVAWGAARFLAGMLYGIRPHDPMTFAAVPVLLLAVAVLASLLPARRAARVDPVEALRSE